jgi:hypothetical protein
MVPSNDFERAAQRVGVSGSLIGELWGFLKHNKKWWLLPILAALAFFGLLAGLASTGAAPFIYTLF